MRIIAKSRLLARARVHGDCEEQVMAWYRQAKARVWHSLIEVRRDYPQTDSVDGYTVFNIKGNDYRLITDIKYAKSIIYIVDLLTHAEYDRGRWKP